MEQDPWETELESALRAPVSGQTNSTHGANTVAVDAPERVTSIGYPSEDRLSEDGDDLSSTGVFATGDHLAQVVAGKQLRRLKRRRAAVQKRMCGTVLQSVPGVIYLPSAEMVEQVRKRAAAQRALSADSTLRRSAATASPRKRTGNETGGWDDFISLPTASVGVKRNRDSQRGDELPSTQTRQSPTPSRSNAALAAQTLISLPSKEPSTAEQPEELPQEEEFLNSSPRKMPRTKRARYTEHERTRMRQVYRAARLNKTTLASAAEQLSQELGRTVSAILNQFSFELRVFKHQSASAGDLFGHVEREDEAADIAHDCDSKGVGGSEASSADGGCAETVSVEREHSPSCAPNESLSSAVSAAVTAAVTLAATAATTSTPCAAATSTSVRSQYTAMELAMVREAQAEASSGEGGGGVQG